MEIFYLVIIMLFMLILYGFFHAILEPAFVYFLNRPVYVHFYFKPLKMTPTERAIVMQYSTFFRRLSPKRQEYFEHRLKTFLSVISFEGREMSVTEEMKVRIALVYVMMTFGMRNYMTGSFERVIIYQDSYQSTITGDFHDGEFNPGHKIIVFSWAAFERGCCIDNDNMNLAIHEFAHAIYSYSLRKPNEAEAMFASRYQRIRNMIRDERQRQVLFKKGYFRDYAYTNEYEFIAVMLEHFFETPSEFRMQYPRLYKQVSEMINYREKSGQ
jgi:MtfA peptidase